MSSLPTNSIPSPFGVSIRNEEDFKSFAPDMNEQRISPQGRMMSPIPHFEFTGLDPNSFYKLNLRFDRILDVKYRFDGNDFVDSGSRLSTPSSSATVDYYQKPQIGKIFMDFGAKFDLLMSNKQDGLKEQAVYLESLCKYQTVLIVTKVAEGALGDFIPIEPPKEFTFDILQFITVTQYHKKSVRQLKTSLHAMNAGKMKTQTKKKERKTSISIPKTPSPKAPHWYPSIGDGQVKYTTYTWTKDHFRIETPVDPNCSIFDDYNLPQTSNSSQSPVPQNDQNSLVTPPSCSTPSTPNIHTPDKPSAFSNMNPTLGNVPVPTAMNNPTGVIIPNQNTYMNSHQMNSMNPAPYGSMNISIPNFLNTSMQPNMDPILNSQMPLPNQFFNGNSQHQYQMNPVQQWPQYFMQPPTQPSHPGYPGHQSNPMNYYPYNN
ncbi:hypothetical protein CAEBREN_25346 [Caenorhabditis brenneri]|uniref:T-box domain-containing protein n=1 Tax=Caenorhabditis brenneri TaxID=135651 RepID=G0PBE7_CAEBE|nr:hypothetical protein CAEBREN_25346 [Caenorhabditis brenneri]